MLLGRTLGRGYGPCCNSRNQRKLLDGGIKERTLDARVGQGLIFKCVFSSVSPNVLNASIFKESLNLLFGVLLKYSFGG